MLPLFHPVLQEVQASIYLAKLTSHEYREDTIEKLSPSKIKELWVQKNMCHTNRGNKTEAINFEALPILFKTHASLTIYGKEYSEIQAEVYLGRQRPSLPNGKLDYSMEYDSLPEEWHVRHDGLLQTSNGSRWGLSPAAQAYLHKRFSPWFLEEAASNRKLLIHLALSQQHQANLTTVKTRIERLKQQLETLNEVLTWAQAQPTPTL
jgi:hypothetical protein